MMASIWIIVFTFSGAGFEIDSTVFKKYRAAYPTEEICKRHLPAIKRSLTGLRGEVDQIASVLPVRMSQPECVELTVKVK